MIYPEHFEQKIGFDKIREQLSVLCHTLGAREKVEEMAFSANYDKIIDRINVTDEMRVICLLEQGFPQDGFADTAPDLKQLALPSYYLDLPALVRLRQMLDTVRSMLRFLSSTKEGHYPELKKLALPIIYYPAIIQRLDSILDKFGGMRDNASPELAEIRKAKRSSEQAVTRKIQSILTQAQALGIAEPEATVSVRDGRVLIPVPSANKRKMDGLVYDESASGKTSFIEPLEIVHLNNRIRELCFAEQREMLKVLVACADFLRPYREELLAAADFLSTMDFIHAKAELALKQQAGKPVVLQIPGIRMQKARHPLLEQALKKEGKEVVPLSLFLTPEKRILLISGPNAGGKSVCLKTVGLLQYMLQCGLLIPCSESSEMGIFSGIFIDIGDEQSLENDLSTYSSHLKNMKEFLLFADAGSLLLVDEFGSGTEPAAGGAMAEAVLEQWEKKGCFGVITTHYANLKFYATGSSAVINGAMQFDVANIQPLFKLEIGVPGNSFAFELARKIGMPESIIAAAQSKTGEGYMEMEKHLKTIARNRRHWEEKVAKIKQTDRALENITDRYESELGEIRRLRKQMLDDARIRAKEIVEGANKQIENTIREIRETQAEKERTRVIRENLKQYKVQLEEQTVRASTTEEDLRIEKKMEQLRRRKERQAQRKAENAARRGQVAEKQVEDAAKETVSAKEMRAGDKVKLTDGGMAAEILEKKGNKLKIAIGELITWVTADKVTGISHREYKEMVRPTPVKRPSVFFDMGERRLTFSPHLDVRGMRLEEALDTVGHFIDDALMLSINDLTILHGKGNGILREEIRKYLKTFGPRLTFCDDHVDRGGAGITMVKLT